MHTFRSSELSSSTEMILVSPVCEVAEPEGVGIESKEGVLRLVGEEARPFSCEAASDAWGSVRSFLLAAEEDSAPSASSFTPGAGPSEASKSSGGGESSLKGVDWREVLSSTAVFVSSGGGEAGFLGSGDTGDKDELLSSWTGLGSVDGAGGSGGGGGCWSSVVPSGMKS